ncbi:MAG: antitoxin VbhA family protein [Ruminococcus sp.]|nr:antitoxin VbhA family protein [Ruminococcus sp.]
MRPKSCLIKDTTKEQRQKIVDDAIALSTLDALPPTDDVMEMVEQYIEGKMEIEDIISVVNSWYNKAYVI